MTFGTVMIRRCVPGTGRGEPAYGTRAPIPSETGRTALGPRIGSGAVAAVDAFDRVGDARAVPVRRHDVDLVPAPPQLLDPGRIEVIFHR